MIEKLKRLIAMCNGKYNGMCSQDSQEMSEREVKAKKLIEMIIALDEDMSSHDFNTVRLEMIRLINEMV